MSKAKELIEMMSEGERKSNQSALQVKKGGGWEYVFSKTNGKIVTTKDRKKALSGDAIKVFQKEFGNDEFRVEQKESNESKSMTKNES